MCKIQIKVPFGIGKVFLVKLVDMGWGAGGEMFGAMKCSVVGMRHFSMCGLEMQYLSGELIKFFDIS